VSWRKLATLHSNGISTWRWKWLLCDS